MEKMITVMAIILMSVALLTGCAGFKQTEFVEVSKPVLACPPPPGLNRPSLAIEHLTPEDRANYGKVAQAYKATVLQLRHYAEEMEYILDAYQGISKDYDEVRRMLDPTLPTVVTDSGPDNLSSTVED
jgi:hypothetical protein